MLTQHSVWERRQGINQQVGLITCRSLVFHNECALFIFSFKLLILFDFFARLFVHKALLHNFQTILVSLKVSPGLACERMIFPITFTYHDLGISQCSRVRQLLLECLINPLKRRLPFRLLFRISYWVLS